MNTNEIIRLLQDFQKLRIDLLKESQISTAGKKIKTLYSAIEKDVRIQELNSQIHDLESKFYQNYFKAKLKLEKINKPTKITDISILEKYFEDLKSFYTKYEYDLKVRLTQMKKIQKSQDNDSIQVLLDCKEEELSDLEQITGVKLRKEISSYRQTKLASNENKKTLSAFKKAEKKVLGALSKIKRVRETGLV